MLILAALAAVSCHLVFPHRPVADQPEDAPHGEWRGHDLAREVSSIDRAPKLERRDDQAPAPDRALTDLKRPPDLKPPADVRPPDSKPIIDQACGSKTCAGCCNAEGNCLAGNTAAACGGGGSTCQTCGPTASCMNGVCTTCTCLGKCGGLDGCGGFCVNTCGPGTCCDVAIDKCVYGTTSAKCGSGTICQPCLSPKVCKPPGICAAY